MSDRVTATWGGFIEIRLRDGKRALLRADDIAKALPRREGGTSIRLRRDCESAEACFGSTILVDCPVSEVIDAIAQAFTIIDGGPDEAGR